MLSTGAFNALLKTLEEPPSYVIFILATTEANKIPVTILSRCQRYDFRRITIDTIAARLSELMEKEGVDVEEKAIRYVAKAGDGSMRDALSLLDQCIAFYLGQKHDPRRGCNGKHPHAGNPFKPRKRAGTVRYRLYVVSAESAAGKKRR